MKKIEHFFTENNLQGAKLGALYTFHIAPYRLYFFTIPISKNKCIFDWYPSTDFKHILW